MTIHIVSTASELKLALETASGGDRIELRAGEYGDVRLRNLDFESEVVVTAHDAEPPRINSLLLSKSSNLTFDGLNFDFEPTIETVEWSSAFKASNSSNISVLNSSFSGGNAVAGISMDAEVGSQGSKGIEGFPIGVGLTFHKTNGIIIENNTVSQFSAGIRFSDSKNIDFNNNEVFDFRNVPIGGGNVSNVHMEGNYFHDPNPWKFGGHGDHGDFVHFWTVPDQDEPSKNFVFRENFFAEGDGSPILGIYLDDNTNDIGFQNVLVEDNVIHNGNAQGLRMEDVVGLTIRNNTMVQSSGDDVRDAPGIHLADGNRDVVIEGNISAGVNGPGMKDIARDNIFVADNMTVQIHDPLAENFVGKLFANGLTENPTLSDLSVLPGSILDGYGANIAELTSCFIEEECGDGLAVNTHNFDLVTDHVGDVIWDFGDGSTAEGKTVQHTFAKAGTYTATATILFKDGSSEQVVKTIQSLSPIIVEADFDNAQQDVVNGVDYDTGQNGSAVRLTETRSTVSFEGTEDLLNNPEFTISLAFQKDAGQEAEGGRILYFSGTAVVNLTATGISLRGSTDAGEKIVLKANNLGLDDSEWHQFTYTASQSDGTAILYLDGTEVARMDGLQGKQHTTTGHDLHIGNPFGENFDGLLDEGAFIRAALTPEQVRQSYVAFRNGDEMFDNLTQDAEDFENGSALEEDWQSVSPDDGQIEIEDDPEDILPTPPAAPSSVLSYTAQSGLTAFEDGQATFADVAGAVTDEGIQLGGKGSAAHIDRAHVADILGKGDFSLSMTLAAGTEASAGEVMRLHSSFIVSVTNRGEIKLRTFDEDGVKTRLWTDGANLSDMSAHEIGISLNDGILAINVDGETLASTEMVAPLADIGAHNLSFGNPWKGANFDGVLSALEITVNESDLASPETDTAIPQDMAPEVPADIDDEETGEIAQGMFQSEAEARQSALDAWAIYRESMSPEMADRFGDMMETALDGYFG